MLDNVLIITQTHGLSLDLKKPQTILKEQKQNSKQHPEEQSFQEVLNEVAREENTDIQIEQKIDTVTDNSLSSLHSMQNNQLLSMKKRK